MDIKKLDVKPLKWETDYLILGKSNSDNKKLLERLPENRLDDVEYISIDSKDLSELDIPDFEKYIEENKIVIVNSKTVSDTPAYEMLINEIIGAKIDSDYYIFVEDIINTLRIQNIVKYTQLLDQDNINLWYTIQDLTNIPDYIYYMLARTRNYIITTVHTKDSGLIYLDDKELSYLDTLNFETYCYYDSYLNTSEKVEFKRQDELSKKRDIKDIEYLLE